MSISRPIIILVRPQLGENIGKAARAMLNFGLTEMRLVAPRDGWPNPSAGPAAAGADIVLDGAKVYATTAEAVADCSHVYATTVRKRGVTKPVVGADGAAKLIHSEAGKHAVLFGPERSGLETEDVALARHILTVPINKEFGSLNLAQAVILVAYEWSRIAGEAAQSDLVQPTAEEDTLPPAPQDDLDRRRAVAGEREGLGRAVPLPLPPFDSTRMDVERPGAARELDDLLAQLVPSRHRIARDHRPCRLRHRRDRRADLEKRKMDADSTLRCFRDGIWLNRASDG